jgi:hypothetical protein
MPYGDALYTVNIILGPVPGVAANLTDVLLLVAKATNPLTGRTQTFTSSTQVATALAATQISATTAAQLNYAFGQTSKRPKTIYVGYVDVVGLETYGAAYTIIKALIGNSFFFVCDQSDDKTQQESISVLIEAEDFLHFYISQVHDVQWYGATWPANYSLFEHREKTAVVWHETATSAQALAYTASRGAWNPDTEKSASWMGDLGSVAAPAALTGAQEGFLYTNKVNLGKALGTSGNFVEYGLNCNGRSIDHIVSAAWVRSALRIQFAYLVQAYASRGDKLTVDAVGGNVCLSVGMGVCRRGVSLGHFQEYTDAQGNKYPAGSYTLDLVNKKITLTLTDYFADQLREIVANVYLNEAV